MNDTSQAQPPFTTLHHWCAAGLGLEQTMAVAADWTDLVIAVTDGSPKVQLGGGAPAQLQTVRASLPVDDDGTVLYSDPGRSGSPQLSLVVFDPSAGPAHVQLARWRASAHVIGLVVVRRGWLRRVAATSTAMGETDAWVVFPGGERWPFGGDGATPAVFAAAVAADGDSAHLARRAAVASAGLDRSAEEQWIDLAMDAPVGYLHLHDNLEFLMSEVFGRPPTLPLDHLVTVPQLIGRWWLHSCLVGIAGHTDEMVALSGFDTDWLSSWRDVIADQCGERRLHDLLTDVEAHAGLSDEIVASLASERTPRQSDVWAMLEDALGSQVGVLRREWAQHPEVHEPHRPVMASDRPKPVRNTSPGRNEPCWCGSGRKFKHCHGAR